VRAWSASGRSLSIATHVARVSHSYLLASYAPLHNIRYGIRSTVDWLSAGNGIAEPFSSLFWEHCFPELDFIQQKQKVCQQANSCAQEAIS
jgi:hypothetical protein